MFIVLEGGGGLREVKSLERKLKIFGFKGNGMFLWRDGGRVSTKIYESKERAPMRLYLYT